MKRLAFAAAMVIAGVPAFAQQSPSSQQQQLQDMIGRVATINLDKDLQISRLTEQVALMQAQLGQVQAELARLRAENEKLEAAQPKPDAPSKP